MARDALVLSWKQRHAERSKAHAAGKKMEFPTRVYHRCQLCHRKGGFMRFFGICRICFRELATDGQIPGVKKASW